MPNKASHARAKCPFFKGDSKMSVACEPHINLTRVNRSEFYSEEGRSLHEERYCFSYKYLECPYAKLLNEKWEDKQNDI